MKKILLIAITLLFIGCGSQIKDETKFKKELIIATLTGYNPPKHFSIIWKLDDGFIKRTSISKHCRVKKDIIGMKINISKYTNISDPTNVLYVVDEPRSKFCGD